MNLYFLVEGKTEKKIYSSWISYLIPKMQKVEFSDQATENNYYIISANGFPDIVREYLSNTIDKLQETPRYNYLILVMDADEQTIEDRINYVNTYLQPYQEQFNAINIKPVIIIQNRCIETWLLGNTQLFDQLQQPIDSPLSEYINYYNVSENDPELMGNYTEGKSYGSFHEQYLKALFTANHKTYTKTKPRDAQSQNYLNQLCYRIEKQPQHLITFQTFIEFCSEINQYIV